MNQNVDFFALGGLDEKNKNCYCLNIDGDLFIFNAGARQVEKPTLGIDEVIPDIAYLLEHKAKIKGVFLTSAINGCAGGLHHMLRELPALPVYVSTTSGRFLKRKYKSTGFFLRHLEFHYVWPRKIIKLGAVRIEVFATNSEFPDSLGYAVYTQAGTIIVMGSNVCDFNKVNNHVVEVKHLSQIAKVQKVLLLIADAPYVGYVGYAVPKYQINHFLVDLNFSSFRRVIFFCVESDLYKVDEFIRLLQVSLSAPLTIKVIGVNLLNIIEIERSNNNKYSKINFVTTGVADVILVSGNLRFLYAKMMEFGIAGQIDERSFTTQDLILLALPLVFGQELNYALALDQLARTDAKIRTLPTNQLHQMKPHQEDIKMLIGLFRPWFFVPVNGLYKELVSACDSASAAGVKRSHCFSLKNGTLLKIRESKFVRESKAIPTGNVFVSDGSGVRTDPAVVEERKQLGVNGALIIVLVVDENKKLTADVKIIHLGMIYDPENDRWMRQVKTICGEIAEKYQNQFTQTKNYPTKEIRFEINRLVARIIRNNLDKKPVILTAIEEAKPHQNEQS